MGPDIPGTENCRRKENREWWEGNRVRKEEG